MPCSDRAVYRTERKTLRMLNLCMAVTQVEVEPARPLMTMRCAALGLETILVGPDGRRPNQQAVCCICLSKFTIIQSLYEAILCAKVMHCSQRSSLAGDWPASSAAGAIHGTPASS